MKRFALFGAIGMLALALIAPVGVSAAPARNQLVSNIPVTGLLSDGGSFTGNLTLTGITRDATGALQFSGRLVGNATDASGVVTAIDQTFSNVGGTLTGGHSKCSILHLDLGPLNLDLLGLQVHLNEVVLNVDAQPGPGNLLGNLLCSVAHLLDGGPLGALNNLLSIINGLLG